MCSLVYVHIWKCVLYQTGIWDCFSFCKRPFLFSISFNNQPEKLHPGSSGRKYLACSPVALVLVDITCRGRFCVSDLQKRVLSCLASRSICKPQLISELNSTSLIDVESDRNIFCSQNVAVIFSMLFYVVSCISMVQTLLREDRCAQKRRELQKQVSQFRQNVFSLDGWLLWVPRLFMVEFSL